MTIVDVQLQVPTRDGTHDPALGRLLVQPVRRIRNGDVIVVAQQFAIVLVEGICRLYLDPTVPGQNAWRITEDITGGGGITRTVTVPDSDEIIKYPDLVDVDPRTLQ